MLATSATPKLSICIPTYNRAQYLSHTLESIIDQAIDDIEIVISDNASIDNTREIYLYYKKRFENIRYHCNESNLGADLNYLKSVELASGEYCWLFGSDDLMKPGSISKMIKEIMGGQDIFVCGFKLCDKNMNPLITHPIVNIDHDSSFNLSSTEERHNYFESAVTTTAFFSLISSIVVKRAKWNQVAVDGKYLGTLWIHAAKCFGMIPFGLQLKYLHDEHFMKRGENDSFADQGLTKRIGISLDGYILLGLDFFGKDSFELKQIRRVLQYEWPLRVFVTEYFNSKPQSADMELVKTTFAKCYANSTLKDRIGRMIFEFDGLRFCYYTALIIFRKAKKLVLGL